MRYFAHNIGDYAAATAHLSFVEDAAYHRLLRRYYQTEKPLPPDVALVCRLIGAKRAEEKRATLNILTEFFVLGERGFTHVRCAAEIASFNEKVAIARANGTKGGRPRVARGLSLGYKTEPTEKLPTTQEPLPIKKDHDSAPNGAAGAPALDLTKTLFDSGIKILGSGGVDAKQARSLLGKWRKDHGDAVVLEALGRCQNAGPSEPVAWMTATLARGGKLSAGRDTPWTI